MKIVFISDTHGIHDAKIPDGDVLVHCGDISGRGYAKELKRFNEWAGTLPHKHKILVPGNHDCLCEEDPVLAASLLSNVKVLINETAEIDGVKFYGTPHQPTFCNWAFNRSSRQLTIIYEQIPEDTDVLVTHTPPYGILDRVEDGRKVGSHELRKRLLYVKPKIHAFGHIHEDYGIRKVSETTFVNASLVNRRYRQTNDPIVVEI